MKALGVIPARWASSRFPGKPLALIHGKPMIQWVISGARTSTELSDILVATDDERIVKAASDVGCRAVMTDSNLPSGTDRIFEASRKSGSDIILNIQGDEPLIDKTWIDPLVIALKDNIQDSLAGHQTLGQRLSMVTLAHPIIDEDLSNSNAVKVLVNQKGQAIYFSRFPIPYSRHTAKELGAGVPCFKHIGMYAFRADFLQHFCEAPVSALERAEGLEQLRALDMGAVIKVILVEKPTLGVDTPEDLLKVEKWLEGRDEKET
ncbi:MAG: 3-deoxy-manno-octulosonate cytidylyltransferase [Bdellovibrionaceae bacterium]|nr:3-deoxy-manno-octulosonate cytidylyltransferase [Pseudobdellovibrionaceae bacterium]